MFNIFSDIGNMEPQLDLFAVGVCNCLVDSCSCAGTCGCDDPNAKDPATMTFTTPSVSLYNRTTQYATYNRRY